MTSTPSPDGRSTDAVRAGRRPVIASAPISSPQAVADLRALTEGEYANLISAEATDRLATLLDELATHALSAGISPLEAVVDHDDTGVTVELRWADGNPAPALFRELLSPRATDWSLRVVTKYADTVGVERHRDGGGRLWCRISTM